MLKYAIAYTQCIVINSIQLRLNSMSRLSINKASIDFNVTRNTLYKYIKQGKLTKDADGKLDSSDLVRLFGSKQSTQQNEQQSSPTNEQYAQQVLQENAQLKQQLLSSEMRINELKQQLEYVKQNEAWLKEQLNQRLIEHKNEHKNQEKRGGIFSKLFR